MANLNVKKHIQETVLKQYKRKITFQKTINENEKKKVVTILKLDLIKISFTEDLIEIDDPVVASGLHAVIANKDDVDNLS